jgi:hypothetical protein
MLWLKDLLSHLDSDGTLDGAEEPCNGVLIASLQAGVMSAARELSDPNSQESPDRRSVGSRTRPTKHAVSDLPQPLPFGLGIDSKHGVSAPVLAPPKVRSVATSCSR